MKYNSLESLRGLAAILVAIYHSPIIASKSLPIIANANIFVDFFFILSGFVMSYAYKQKIIAGLKFKDFTLLRIGRLYPLHLFMLLIWVPFIFAKGYVFHFLQIGGNDPFVINSFSTFISNLLLVNSLNIHSHLSWNYPAWSISLEFYTYLIFFFFLVLFRRFYRPYYSLIFSLLSYAALYTITEDSLLRTYDFGLLRCVGGFFLGVYIQSLTEASAQEFNKLQSNIYEIIIIFATLFLILNISNSKIIEFSSFILFGCTVYLFSIQDSGIISRFLNLKPMIFLGTISYSIYLTHAIIFTIIDHIWVYLLKMPVKSVQGTSITYFDTPYGALLNAIILLTVVGFSYFTYSYIEKPWRNKFRRKISVYQKTTAKAP